MDAAQLNMRITILLDKSENYVNNCLRNDEPFEPACLKKILSISVNDGDFLDFCRERADKRNVSASTRKQYHAWIRRMERFGGIVAFSDIDAAHVKMFDEWMHGNGFVQSSVYSNHKYLKLMINDAIVFKKLKTNPYTANRIKIGRGESENIEYLSEKEMHAIEQAKMPNAHLEKARDLFVFQMYTGLAYTDLMEFDPSQYTADRDYFQQGRRRKTGTRFMLQLLKPAKKVLKKYDWKLPIITNQKYNDYLKVVASLSGVKKKLHSHMARSTFATFMLSKGCPVQNVARMLGHTNLRQTMRYASVLAVDVQSDFKKIDRLL